MQAAAVAEEDMPAAAAEAITELKEDGKAPRMWGFCLYAVHVRRQREDVGGCVTTKLAHPLPPIYPCKNSKTEELGVTSGAVLSKSPGCGRAWGYYFQDNKSEGGRPSGNAKIYCACVQ